MSASTATEAIGPIESAPPSPATPPRPLLKLAETGLATLREFAANPDAFLSGEGSRGLSENARAAWTDARLRFREFQREAETYIRANPTKAVFGAVGVGFVLGVLLKR